MNVKKLYFILSYIYAYIRYLKKSSFNSFYKKKYIFWQKSNICLVSHLFALDDEKYK